MKYRLLYATATQQPSTGSVSRNNDDCADFAETANIKNLYLMEWATVKSKSILMKTVICCSVYLLFSLLPIFMVYIMDLYYLPLFLGLGVVCGVVIAAVTYCDTVKKTIIARIMGILSAYVLQFILYISRVPYIIIIYFETWTLAGFEGAAYNTGVDIFWQGLLISFIISIISIFFFNEVRKRRKHS